MFEASRSYYLKFERILIPMAKGDRSRRVLDIAFDLSRLHDSEITAFTVKDEVHDLTWSDKVSLVTEAYKAGKERDVKVVPKVKTSRSVRECITEEANTHGYDLMLIATTRRAPLSASVFGGIGDYVIKNSRVPVVAASVKTDDYPYRSILFPVSESVNTRPAASYALHLKKATGAKLYLADLRQYDRKKTHGFNLLFDSMDYLLKTYGGGIEITRGGLSTTLNDEISLLSHSLSADAVVVGVRSDQAGRVRLSSSIKSIIKESTVDTMLVKK